MNNTVKIAALFGMLAVALGAFGAHSLRHRLGESEMEVFKTAVSYQFYHTLALLALGIIQSQFNNKWLGWSANLFITGILLFSGSLYVITACNVAQVEVPVFIGPVTPIGGILFMAGWLLLFFGCSKRSV